MPGMCIRPYGTSPVSNPHLVPYGPPIRSQIRDNTWVPFLASRDALDCISPGDMARIQDSTATSHLVAWEGPSDGPKQCI